MDFLLLTSKGKIDEAVAYAEKIIKTNQKNNFAHMVVALSQLKNKQFDAVLDEIKAVKNACGGKLLKVIIETCYLTDEEKEKP